MFKIELTIKDIIEQANGKLIYGNVNMICSNFSKDTRQINPGDVYLGIKGEKFNGSEFYEEALKKGASICIVQEVDIKKEIIEKYKNCAIIMVNDVVKCIQKLAKYKRSLYNIPVVAITGSVGKTSTKDIIANVLAKKYKVLKTEGNYNNEIGLPLTVLKLKDHTAMVLEMGMNSLGEISLLTNIAKPTTCVITNIGTSHIGKLGSRENILKAKLEILEGLQKHGTIVINNDNDLLHDWYENNKNSYSIKTYGINENSNFMATNIMLNQEKSNYSLQSNKKSEIIDVPVAGKHFIYNSLCAICVGDIYNIPIKEISNAISNFKLTKKRMDILEKANGVKIINDCYNASYESMKVALECLAKMDAPRKIAVLGDMFELGEYTKELHSKVGEEVVKNNVDILITVGENSKEIGKEAIRQGFNKTNIFITEDANNATKKLKELLKTNDIILIKASNGMKLDSIAENIQ